MATQNKATEQEEAKALTINDVAALVLDEIRHQGETTTEEIIEALRLEQPELEPRMIERATIKLDRAGLITRQSQAVGWQITARGQNAEATVTARNIAALLVPYGTYTWFTARYRLLTPSLGPETGPGGTGKSSWPRMPDGQIVFRGGWLRAALQKAMDRLDSTVLTLVGPRRIPAAAWEHVAVRTLLLPADTPLVDKVRRPVSTRGQAVGEIIHEALPEGAEIEVQALFPLSHFNEQFVRSLFEMAGFVGLSPAGSGKGGTWGVAELLSVKRQDSAVTQAAEVAGSANGKAVMPAA